MPAQTKRPTEKGGKPDTGPKAKKDNGAHSANKKIPSVGAQEPFVGDIEDLCTRFVTGKANSAFSAREVIHVRDALGKWYASCRRHLPWRGDSYELVRLSSTRQDTEMKQKEENDDERKQEAFVTPPQSGYGTWVSEIMLQQTRVETVIPVSVPGADT
jgi:A/G-specific adenine glycosylase